MELSWIGYLLQRRTDMVMFKNYILI